MMLYLYFVNYVQRCDTDQHSYLSRELRYEHRLDVVITVDELSFFVLCFQRVQCSEGVYHTLGS